MRAPDISQSGLADPAPADQLIPAPAAARTAAGQSMSGLTVLSTYLKPRALQRITRGPSVCSAIGSASPS